jgi:hypothetical protein
MTEPMYDSTLLAMAYERQSDVASNFCRICWGPLDECPGHQGWMEMFGPPPTEAERAAYLADLEVRERGLERKHAALDAAAKHLGYDSIEALSDEVWP